jgi:hypothetical protein
VLLWSCLLVLGATTKVIVHSGEGGSRSLYGRVLSDLDFEKWKTIGRCGGAW